MHGKVRQRKKKSQANNAGSLSVTDIQKGSRFPHLRYKHQPPSLVN